VPRVGPVPGYTAELPPPDSPPGTPDSPSGTIVLGSAGGLGTTAYLNSFKETLSSQGYEIKSYDLESNQMMTDGFPQDTVGIVFAGHGGEDHVGWLLDTTFAHMYRKLDEPPKFIVLSFCHSQNFLNNVDNSNLDYGGSKIPSDVFTITADGYHIHGGSMMNAAADVWSVEGLLKGDISGQDDIIHYDLGFDMIGYIWFDVIWGDKGKWR
jgi:hypothetical protein